MFENTCHCSCYIGLTGFRGQTQLIFFDFFVLYLFRFAFFRSIFWLNHRNFIFKTRQTALRCRPCRKNNNVDDGQLSLIHTLLHIKPSVSIIKIIIITAPLLNYDVASHHMCTCNTYFDIYMRKYHKTLRKILLHFYIIFGTKLCHALSPSPLFL